MKCVLEKLLSVKRRRGILSLLLALCLVFPALFCPLQLQVEAATLQGDLDESGAVDAEDAIWLLFHAMFTQRYPVSGNTDLDQNGKTDAEDAIRLLFHVMFPERYSLPVPLYAGFARVVANPEAGTGMGGYGNPATRLSGEILDDICISCVALTDGEQTLLFYSFDACGIGRDHVWKPVTERLKSKLGIPAENVILNASHSHSAPALGWKYSNNADYLESVYEKCETVARLAIADLSETRVKIGRAEADQNMSYVRRYLRYDGKWASSSAPVGGTSMPNNLDPAVYYHESEGDREVQLIVFDRLEKKDIVLCNWQCHVTAVGGSESTEVSSDYVGAFRDTVEKEADVYCSFFQGAAGSMVPSGKLRGEAQNHKDYKNHGKRLAATVLNAMEDLTVAKTDKIRVLNQKYAGTVKEDKIESYGNTYKLSLTTLSFGDVSFATAPVEMDHRNGVFVKENSPYSMTFVCGYTNGSHGYLPAASSYPNGGYEVNSTRFAAGTGEEMAAVLVSMLNAIEKE